MNTQTEPEYAAMLDNEETYSYLLKYLDRCNRSYFLSCLPKLKETIFKSPLRQEGFDNQTYDTGEIT